MKHASFFLAITGVVLSMTAMNAITLDDNSYHRLSSGSGEKGLMSSGTFINTPYSGNNAKVEINPAVKKSSSIKGTQLYYAYPEGSDYAKYKIVDSNNDGYTWSAPGLYGMSYSGGLATMQADDWCILPGINMDDASVFYNFYCEARGAMDANPEDFDVYIGKSPDVASMTTKILEVRNLEYKRDMNLYDKFEKNFLISSPGTYYIGFHAISPATSCAFYVRNIYLTKTSIKSVSPAQVSDVNITGNSHGGLTAGISFKMPVANNLNETYGNDKTITVKIVSPAEKKTVTGAPGSLQNVVIKTLEGDNEITITTSDGNNEGLPYTAFVYTGLDVPGSPENITSSVSENNMTLTLKWDAPTVGANGGYVDPDNMDYYIYKYNDAKETWTYMDFTNGETEYSTTVKPSAGQQNIILGVAAVNIKDEETPESLYAVTSGVIGRPYSTPFIEEFKIGNEIFNPVVKEVPSDEYDTYLWFGTPAEGLGSYADLPGRNCYIAFSRQSGKTSYSRTVLPKISTMNMSDGQAGFYIFINYETPKTQFYITDFSGKETLLGTIDQYSGSGGWTMFTYDIPDEYLGQSWVNFIIKAEYDNGWGQFMTLGGYELTSIMDHDLAISSLRGEKALTSEETGYYTAVVENRGRSDEDLRIKAEVFDDEDNLLTTLTLMDHSDPLTIEKEEKGEYHWQYAPTDSHEGTVTLRVTVLNDDDRADNNVFELPITVKKALRPEVDEFALTGNEGNIVLNWGTPVIHIHDSFEDYDAFSYDEYLGYLLNYDEDGLATFTLNGLSSFPGSEAAKAWQVFSVSKSGIVGSNYAAPDGDQYLIAFGPYDSSAASDWLLSPMIKGGSDVSFKMNIVGDYDEYLDVVYAVKSAPELSDFRILDGITKTKFGWEEFKYNLPSNATFWGLHYVSADCFGVMIDELDYKVDFNGEVVGHNVYRNGVKIASDLKGYTYSDPEGKAGDKYTMTVSYINASKVKNEGKMSDALTFSDAGAGNIESAPEIIKVVYTTPSGIVITDPVKGVFIRSTYYNDGTVVTDKVVK